MSEEMWAPIPGFSMYEVSSVGRIRRVAPGRGTRAGHILRPSTASRGGYNVVGLQKDERRHGAAVTRLIGQLVCEVFNGPRPDGYVLRHLDGNPQNDVYTNLKWGTQAENMADMVRHGRHNNARKTHCKNGHPFSPENTATREYGNRRCRACARAAQERFYERRRAAA